MRLFFSHPIWSVAEAAATTLSALIVEDDNRRAKRLAIIVKLLEDASNWRVQFGAIRGDAELVERIMRE